MRSSALRSRLSAFVEYARSLAGDERGEAQVFCDRLLQAFGHGGVHEAGAKLEYRVRPQLGGRTKYADLVWPARSLLLEMKKRGERLQRHYHQIFHYWTLIVPHRPRFTVLCNFDEFWIYDFKRQLGEPVDRVSLERLPERAEAFGFLLPEQQEPLFENNKEAVTQDAARRVASVFRSMVQRGEAREACQRFVLQAVVAMFSEDVDLLPGKLFTRAISAEDATPDEVFDLLTGLFRQMASAEPARGGRFRKVPYFNGGIFDRVEPVPLAEGEVDSLRLAARTDWSKVNPAIFGTLFQESMDEAERHQLGAHYTSEAEIQRVVFPTVIKPLRRELDKARSKRALRELREQITTLRILDPACGSGNFLYSAFRELLTVELDLLARYADRERSRTRVADPPRVSIRQLYGIDKSSFAVELAKITLTLAKELSFGVVADWFENEDLAQEFQFEQPLPLDNLDEHIICDDALFCDWPSADIIIGNPPYQSANKAQAEYGRAYLNRVRQRYPDVPGRADYCVYWFRRAHDELPVGGRAGMVGTKTIRENQSRIGGLDYIVRTGGCITEAVAFQVWPGAAAVHVSIVNWKKGGEEGKKKLLFEQVGTDAESPYEIVELDEISSSLSRRGDFSSAVPLEANRSPKTDFQGVTHGNEGLLLSREDAEDVLAREPDAGQVLLPYLISSDLLDRQDGLPQRYVINFSGMEQLDARANFPALFQHVKESVLPERRAEAEREARRNEEARRQNPKARINRHHEKFLKHWWQPKYGRREMVVKLRSLPRYIVLGRVGSLTVLSFVASPVLPGDSLQVFSHSDDYSFGILSSTLHRHWMLERCSSLGAAPRYTSRTVYQTFPWPQSPSDEAVLGVAKAASTLLAERERIRRDFGLTLREMHEGAEDGAHPLADAQAVLDGAVCRAFALPRLTDDPTFLLELNATLADKEQRDEAIDGPGVPSSFPTSKRPDLQSDFVIREGRGRT